MIGTATSTPTSTRTPTVTPTPDADTSCCACPCCPGDCNGDGTTTQAEVDKCLEAYLTDQTWLCTACDVDNDGDVEPSEVVLSNIARMDGCDAPTNCQVPISGVCSGACCLVYGSSCQEVP
jgi:hypothetical protein